MGREALLVMDMQQGIVARFASGAPALLANLRRAIDAAHATQRPVVYVRVAFRPGAPEVSARNKSFAALASNPGFEEDAPATQIVAELAPRDGDVVVVKRRVSAFASDLDVVLRGLDVDALVLSGLATSGVVLSTLRQAADLDFACTVLADGCADADEEVHRVLTEKVFVRQATVVTTDEWIASL